MAFGYLLGSLLAAQAPHQESMQQRMMLLERRYREVRRRLRRNLG